MITTLVNAKEKPIKSAKTVRAIVEVGAAVNVAVERFVFVGQAIADDSLDIKTDMYAACNDARAAGAAIQRLTEIQMDKSGNATMASTCKDKKSMVRAARALLSSATKVLLLADTVVVKQLLSAKEKVSISLNRLENVANFTEFVKAFGLFGSEMVELAHLTGDRQNDLKDEKRRAQMTSARQILERSTMMLLTASKTCLRHPDCETARENRDTVFCQMRRAMDMIHYVVKDGVIPDLAPSSDASTPTSNSAMSNGNKTSSSRSKRSSNFAAAAAVVGISSGYDDLDNNFTVHNTIKRFEDIVEMTRMTLVGAGYREKLTSALEKVVECTQDFTDSAYTSHEHRQSILMLCDRTNFQLNHLLNVDSSTANMEQQEMNSPSEELETAIVSMLNATYDLRKELQDTALEQVEDIQNLCHDQQVLYSLRNSSLSGDAARLEECSERFLEQAEHLHEVCKLIWHIAQGNRSQVSAKHTETSIRIYGPQIISAGKTVCMFPNSKIAKENLNVFIDVWTTLLRDMNGVVKEVLDHHYNQHHGSHSPHYQTQVHHQQQQHHHHHHHHRHYQQQQQQLHQDQHLESEKFASQSRQQKHSSTGKSKPVKLDCEEQAKIAKLGLEMKLLTSEIDAETEKWEESENNDIVKKAKNMSAMAFTMYQFTKGEGMLKTTQDLFTQAEYFAEDANKLYKLVRQFSYQVPASGQKSSLLEYLDKVPTYVQQLQYTVKNPTVGKAATFTKVDNVIQETKNLMNVISKVVSTCFICATKYNLEFQGCSGGSGGGGGSSGRSSQNMSPLNRMDSMDESNDASRLNDSYGNNSTGSGATSLSKMSNGQSAANPNI